MIDRRAKVNEEVAVDVDVKAVKVDVKVAVEGTVKAAKGVPAAAEVNVEEEGRSRYSSCIGSVCAV